MIRAIFEPMKKYGLLFLILLWTTCAFAQLPPIGQWRAHLPWNSAIRLLHDGERIWWASPFSIAAIDPISNEIERWTKVNGLSETGVQALGWNSDQNALVVVWQNQRINILREGNLRAIEDLANSAVTGDKTVNDIICQDRFAYLLTNSGIVVIDLQRDIVSATFIIGSNGSRVPVTGLARDAGNWYAATAEGLKSAPLNAANLSDYRNWTGIGPANGLRNAPVKNITQSNNRLYCVQSDTVFVQNGNQWNVFYTDGWSIRSLQASGNKLLVCEQQGNSGRIVSLQPTTVVDLVLQDARYTASPQQALWLGSDLWYADSLAGLVKRSGNNLFAMGLAGPPAPTPTALQIADQQVYASFGQISRAMQPQGNKTPVALFKNDEWTVLPGNTFDSLPDILTLSAERSTNSLWGGSFGGGLFQYTAPNTWKVYKQNGPLQPQGGAGGPYRVSGLAFDTQEQLWVSNYGANLNLHVRKTDGNWRSFAAPFPLNEAAVSSIVIDELDQKWIIAPNGQGLLCFNNGATVDNTADDRWKWYRSGSGNGNLPSNEVLSIVKDRNSFIWVGTTRGIGIIQCVQEVFSNSGCEALLPVVQQDNFAGYLFRDEEVQAMAVDGADRKWIGTRNGVWLISPDGEKTIYRFTSANSPLPSNDIRAIAIDESTGEVFFSTARGMVSFRSTATAGAETQSNVLVYPNPVPPGYTGTIAIRGLTDQAFVKITEPDGRLVFETRALGGQAIWNGKNYKGQAIRSGVYLVLISDETKKQKAVTRIVFIAK